MYEMKLENNEIVRVASASPGPLINGTEKLILILAMLAVFLLVFCAPLAVYPQADDDLDVNKVIKDVKERFHLSSGDIKSIRPLLYRENNNVLAIYARFSSDSEPEYSNRVWQELIESHCEFRARAQAGLTARQLAALRSARLAMETQIVEYLLTDYVDFLGQFLELDKWEFSDVQRLFEQDKLKKLKLFDTPGLVNFGTIEKEVAKISDGTERQLRGILTADQWRDYRSLTESLTPFA
jgi:hypothetical protein